MSRPNVAKRSASGRRSRRCSRRPSTSNWCHFRRGDRPALICLAIGRCSKRDDAIAAQAATLLTWWQTLQQGQTPWAVALGGTRTNAVSRAQIGLDPPAPGLDDTRPSFSADHPCEPRRETSDSCLAPCSFNACRTPLLARTLAAFLLGDESHAQLMPEPVVEPASYDRAAPTLLRAKASTSTAARRKSAINWSRLSRSTLQLDTMLRQGTTVVEQSKTAHASPAAPRRHHDSRDQAA